MDSKILGYIAFIIGSFFLLFREYYYRRSIKKDKYEESTGRNILSWATYLCLVYTVYVLIKLIIIVLN